ncbi:MAG: putative peptidoglycan binding domain [Candidatus Parcubacteria bacterium]|jgi:hypothetical protein
MNRTHLGISLFLVLFFMQSFAYAACTVPTATLQLGSRDTGRSTQVTLLQKALKTRYPETIVNGYFGGKTRALVIRFQKEMKLPQTGKVGPQTREKLRLICASGAVQPPSASCKVFFDGCNICARDAAGGALRCTMRACPDVKEQPAVCKEFFGVAAANVPAPQEGEAMCTKEYKPQCGTPYSCLVNDFKDSVPRECTHGTTFSNKCMLDAQKAIFLHDGECAK